MVSLAICGCEGSRAEETCEPIASVDVSEAYRSDQAGRGQSCPALPNDRVLPAVPLRFVNSSDAPVGLLPSSRGPGFVDPDADPRSPPDCESILEGERWDWQATSSATIQPGEAFEHVWLAHTFVRHELSQTCYRSSNDEDVACVQRVALPQDERSGVVRAFRAEGCKADEECSVASAECPEPLGPKWCDAVALFEVAFEAGAGSDCDPPEIDLAPPPESSACGLRPWCDDSCPVSTAEHPLCGLPCDPSRATACGTPTEMLRCVEGTWVCEAAAPTEDCPACVDPRTHGAFIGSCTEEGCADLDEQGLSIELAAPLPEGTYTVEIDGAEACTFEVPAGCGDGSCEDHVEATCLVWPPMPERNPNFVVELPFRVDPAIRISRGGETVAERQSAPTFETRASNGSGCGPVCIGARVSLAVAE